MLPLSPHTTFHREELLSYLFHLRSQLIIEQGLVLVHEDMPKFQVQLSFYLSF
jgi:hypothetical protein